MIEAVLSGNLKLDAEQWNILVVERDVPCAHIAIADIKEAYQHLYRLDGTVKTLPKINLDVVSTNEFKESQLHLGKKVLTDIPTYHYDVCIDIAMLMRDNIDALPLNVDADNSYIVRSSHYNKCERIVYCANNIEYRPLVNKTERGDFEEIESQKQDLTYFLQNIFRKRAFRTGQLPILSRALSGKTTIGLLPTGGGKSLTYQLASMLEPGVTLVVDPLISLMVDQVKGLNDIRIDSCAYINSAIKEVEEKYERLRELQDGCLHFAFLSPERFMMENFRGSLETMSEENNVYFSYGVIDEVHCVSEWGHDFRPAYLHLGRNMMTYMHTKTGNKVPIVGLTATASFDVLSDVERELTLGDLMTIQSDTIVRPEDDKREELTYKVIEVNANFDTLKNNANQYVLSPGVNDWSIRDCVADAKKVEILDLLREIPEDIEEVDEDKPQLSVPNYDKEQFYDADDKGLYPNAGIIFCPHAHGALGVNDTEHGNHIGISTYMRTNSKKISIGTFVGGDNPEGDMKAFNNNEQNLMVATKAFGMGIDKPNVRFTINITHPSSIESFVQEAGRAGRDKKNAISYLLYEPTEFICLTEDKLNVIAIALGLNTIPVWLWNNRNRYVLKKDLANLGVSLGVSIDEANKVLHICEDYKYFENEDENVELWFHNNSFRGVGKEKYILYELTHNLLNATANNGISIPNAGIYSVLSILKTKDYAYVVVTWENMMQQNTTAYIKNIDSAIATIAQKYNWNKAAGQNWDNEADFFKLLQRIAHYSNDYRWVQYYSSSNAETIYKPLLKAFYQRRDKSDTDKAIYRLCCIGIVDDVLIDYNAQTYTLKVRKKTDDEYIDTMRLFFRKYYSNARAEEHINLIMQHSGNNILDKCLGYLTEFVYSTLERKRFRAIDDMRLACQQSIEKGEEGVKWLKEFIHLYFNSKYARDGYTINGEPYSLNQDIVNGEECYSIVEKYIKAIHIDNSGTDIDNVRHLYGAVLLVLRAYPDNGALHLLRTYCLIFLGIGKNAELRKDAHNSYVEGFVSLHDRCDVDVYPLMDQFNSILDKTKKDDYIKDDILDNGKAEVSLIIHQQWTDKFKNDYLKDW